MRVAHADLDLHNTVAPNSRAYRKGQLVDERRKATADQFALDIGVSTPGLSAAAGPSALVCAAGAAGGWGRTSAIGGTSAERGGQA
jgi:hypothetical protein